MFRILLPCVVLLMLVPVMNAGPRDQSASSTPIMKVVQPETAKVGDEITVSGTSLETAWVAEVYITQGANITKVKITSQTATDVKFRIPATAKPGRFGIMVLTTGGDEARYIDEPVFITVQ